MRMQVTDRLLLRSATEYLFLGRRTTPTRLVPLQARLLAQLSLKHAEQVWQRLSRQGVISKHANTELIGAP